MEDRLMALEIQLTHQQRHIDELNDLLYHQQQTLDKVQMEVAAVKEHLSLLAPSLVCSEDEELPPPHY